MAPLSGWYLLRWQGHDSELMLRHSEDTGTGLAHFVGVGRWQEAQEGVRVRRQNMGNLGWGEGAAGEGNGRFLPRRQHHQKQKNSGP